MVYLVRVPFSSDIAVHTEADIGPQSGLSNEIPHNIVLNSLENNLFLRTYLGVVGNGKLFVFGPHI